MPAAWVVVILIGIVLAWKYQDSKAAAAGGGRGAPETTGGGSREAPPGPAAASVPNSNEYLASRPTASAPAPARSLPSSGSGTGAGAGAGSGAIAPPGEAQQPGATGARTASPGITPAPALPTMQAPSGGFYNPPAVASTGNVQIDALIARYNKAVYLRGGSADPSDYIAKAMIEPGTVKPLVHLWRISDLKGGGTGFQVAQDNFFAFVDSFAGPAGV